MHVIKQHNAELLMTQDAWLVLDSTITVTVFMEVAETKSGRTDWTWDRPFLTRWHMCRKP